MGARVINVYFRVVMPANRLRVNYYDLMALKNLLLTLPFLYSAFTLFLSRHNAWK